MSVHDALHRTVTGRHESRRDRQAAIERDAAEIEAQRDRDALDVQRRDAETAAATTGGTDGNPT